MGSATPTPPVTPSQALKGQTLQGMGPTTIATTGDGEFAYIGFHLSDVVIKVRLKDLAIEASADLSDYFPLQCYHVVLDASERRLFVHSASWRELLVLDTQTMSVVHTIYDVGAQDIIRSQNGPFLIAWDGGNTVKLINTETYEVTDFTDDRIGFIQIEESKSDQDKWYVVTQDGPEGPWVIGIYDHKAKAWVQTVTGPWQGVNSGIQDLMALPDERKLYVAVWGGYYLESQTHGYGWLYSVDLGSWEVNVIPIDGSEFSLDTTPDGHLVYVGANWPKPRNSNNIQIVDTQADAVVGSIDLSRLARPYFSEVRDLQIDLANPRYLYAVSNDANAFIKVDLDSLSLAGALFFNQESLQPSMFAKRPGQATSYILVSKSAHAFELELDDATLKDVVTFPGIRDDATTYDVAVNGAGNLLIAQGENMLEVDPHDMRLLGTHPIPSSIGGLWHFVLSNDRTRIYSIWQDPVGGREYSDVFLALDAATLQVIKRIKLDGGAFNERPYELPDGSKLYALGGWDWGSITVQVIRTDDYTVQKTITYDPAGDLGISAGPYFPYAYDSNSHTLFVGAGTVVLAIDSVTDEIEKVIDLGDVARAIGLEPQQFIYVNAIGLVYQPEENYLYIAHLDRAFISIYDLNNGRFLSRVIPLKGFFPNYMFANDDRSKIYTLNALSDSISVIDVKSKAVDGVIDLHGEWVTIRTMPEEVSILVDDVQCGGGGLFEWANGSVHAITAPESVSSGEGVRLLFSEWDDGNRSLSRSLVVSGPSSCVAIYKKQYYLTLISDYGSPTGSGWYDDGAIATVGLASGEEPAGFPYANFFVGWGGDAQGNGPSSSILMDGPKTAIAIWERRLSSSFYVCLGGASFGIALVAVFLLKEKRKVKQKEES